jgi:hypothetical protein
VAVDAQGDEVQFVVVALSAPQLLMLELQVLSRTTDLTSPAIALQYLFLSWSYGSGSGRKRGRLGRIRFTKLSR